MLELGDIVEHFAEAFKAADATGASHKLFAPGIGPFGEPEGVECALNYLKSSHPKLYASAAPKRYPGKRASCDVVIDGHWALEFKLIRPFGNNGGDADHWLENLLYPYPGNRSAIGDCLKLASSDFSERKGVVVYGFEHSPPLIELETAVRAFELIAREVVGVRLRPRYECTFTELIHPVHQQGRIYAWEVLEVASYGT